jgi:NADPH:quinone reductase-like Zn-dependent oxidoreductase
MKAVVIHDYGSPDVLHVETVPDPIAGPGEVLVRISGAGINPIDTIERAGAMKAVRSLSFPAILGWDLAGTVEKIGPRVTSFTAGDKLFGWAYHTYAELCAVKAELLAKVPDGLDLIAAAALPLVTVTGNQLVSVAAGARPGQVVLVSGAAGSVGRSAVFTAKSLGATVIAGVLRKQVSEAASIGADQVVALDDQAAFDAIAPVDAVANTVRGRTPEQLIAKVKPGGVFASVTGAPANAGDYPSVRVVSYVSKQDAATMRQMAEAVHAGKLAFPVAGTLPLKDAAAGHRAVESGGAGKLVLLP